MSGLLAAPAAAAGPPATGVRGGAFFGGGSNPSRTRSIMALVALRTRSAKRLDLWVDDEDFKCKGAGSEAFIVVRGVKINGAGQFQASGHFSLSPGGTYRLTGRFTGNQGATGTLRATAGTCRMGMLRWDAADPAAGLGSGRQQGGATYAGYFSQRSGRIDVDLPMVMRLSRSGRALQGAAARPNMSGSPGLNCGEQSRFLQIWFDHRFRSSFTDVETFTVPVPEPGDVGVVRIVWGGRFHAHKVAGTWRETVELKRTSDGKLLGVCADSGRLTWQAAAGSG